MTIPNFREESAVAPVNIAVIKYWGKRDSELILPCNSSISVTLDTNDLHTHTSARISPDYIEDRFWLNGKELSLKDSPRLMKCLKLLKQKRKQLESDGVVQPQISDWKIHVKSENNFPTAAGLASSASGIACFVYVIARLFELITEDSPDEAFQELSKIARQGSGSACRSLFGGYVKWEAGVCDSGADSFAVQVASKSSWPDLKAIVLVANDEKKEVSSTGGMQTTVETSELFNYRVESVVPERIREMENAIKTKDFDLFAELTMADSNQFHATCLDTYPPIFYLNDTSKMVIQFVTALNKFAGRNVACYTFDAGPNAVLFVQEKDLKDLCACLTALIDVEHIPMNEHTKNVFDRAERPEYFESLASKFSVLGKGLIRRVIMTGVGAGPSKCNESLF
jgi:diphosphomevalonate decarboxylase